MPTPKNRESFRLGIVNPLSLVGHEITTILRERSFPFGDIRLLDSTGESAGAVTEVIDEPRFVTPVSSDELEDLDLVFFCGAPASNREWIERYGEDRFIAVDLSQPTTTEGGKLAVAGVNLQSIDAGDTLLVSPHPVAIPIALILHQLATVAPVELCAATVIQPASEFGDEGVDELAKQTIAALNVQTMPQAIFGRQLAFNLYPAREQQEAFIVSQVRSLIDVRTPLALSITQATIFHGHTFSMFVKTKEKVTAERLIEALRGNAAIAFPEGDQEIGTIDAAGRDEVLISELRADPAVPGGFWVWAVCDNLRRSSALNAVLVAEQVLFGSAN